MRYNLASTEGLVRMGGVQNSNDNSPSVDASPRAVMIIAIVGIIRSV